MREVNSIQIGHRISQLREQAGLKQADLAKQVTWSPAVLSRVEAGERELTPDELSSLLNAIGTPAASQLVELVGRTWVHLREPALDHPDQDLLWAAESRLTELRALADSPDTRPVFQRRIDEYAAELRRLAENLIRREHTVAFIGSIGIGKSTAICRATGLEVDGPSGRRLPVLEAGGGGVTLCEVHLREGPGYGLVMEPRSHEDIRVDVTDFVDQLLRSGTVADESEGSDDPARSVPRELARTIRNMSGLQQIKSKGDGGKTIRTDPAKALAESVGDRRELVVEILSRMELHKRDRRDEWHDASSGIDPLDWLKVTFERINNGRHPEFSIPSRIELVVPSVLPMADLSLGIIDTRGLDQPAARADLEAHLEDPHTVVLLCSGFNDAPASTVHHLLRRAREIGNTQVGTHTAVLVLPRPDEALAVKDESGTTAETVDEGYDLKSDQARNALSQYDLAGIPIGFFNSFEDDPAALRRFISDLVVGTRSVFRSRLDEVLDQAGHLLNNAILAQASEVQREAARHIAAWIGQHEAPAPVAPAVHDSLLSEIRIANANSVHAAIRREGEWYALSYSHQLGHGARMIAVAGLGQAVAGFRDDLCGTLSESLPEAAELLGQASRLMTQAYEDLLRKVQLAGSTLYREQLQRDAHLWASCESEWGRGGGYRERVAGRNEAWFAEPDRLNLEQGIKQTIEKEWDTVRERVSSIFELPV